jgi:hypothetical protein
MDRHIEEIRAAAKRHSFVWSEIFALADRCYESSQMTGSYEALSQRYVLKSGILITGRDAMKLVLAVDEALKNVPNVDAEVVWKDLDEIINDLPASATA